MNVTVLDIARRFVGVEEIPGHPSNPMILSMLRLDTDWPEDDAVPWCSAFANYPPWLLRLPRSKSLRARSWLNVGEVVAPKFATPGYDVVILQRGLGPQPGPDVIDAPGHVGFFTGWDGDKVALLGGNQSDSVNISLYPRERILGVRRLYTGP